MSSSYLNLKIQVLELAKETCISPVVMDEPLSISAYVSAPFMVMLDSLEWPISLSKKLWLIGLGWSQFPVCPSTETSSNFPNDIWKFCCPFSLSFDIFVL